MKAMVLEQVGKPLVRRDVPIPSPGPGQLLLEVSACAVCRTDLHLCDGDLPPLAPRRIPGHEIIGIVRETGSTTSTFQVGDRVGAPWLSSTCQTCEYCLTGRENLCDLARFTGYHCDGGYAEFTVANEQFCFRIPEFYDDISAAPLLCAGLIGYRCLRMAGTGRNLGLYGFGAAAHIALQTAMWQGQDVFAFSRPGDEDAQQFARSLGAIWAGDSTSLPPQKLDAAIIFAPVGSLVPAALKAVRKGGIVVCGGIHMSDIPSFSYDLLWGERVVRSVANLTCRDGHEFLDLAPQVPIRTTTECFPLSEANTALDRLRQGRLQGAAVLLPHR